ncbi:MAG: hypothetical protein ACTSQJ_13685, partial [Promethearchaeota archaeon]
MEEDPFFFDPEKKEGKEEEKATEIIKQKPPQTEAPKEENRPKLPKIEVKPVINKTEIKNEKIKVSKKAITKPTPSMLLDYTNTQRLIGTIFYIAFVVACIITIAGAVWAIFDFISPTGKLDTFLSFGLGIQIAIVSAFLAGFFFILIFFFGLFKKGRKTLVRIIFRGRDLEDQYK